MLENLQNFMDGKKRYFLILAQAVYSFLGAFNVITTTGTQDVAFTVLVLAMLGMEINSKR